MADTEYISKEAALSCFANWIDRYGHEHSADEMAEYQRIEDLPVEDVRPVVTCGKCKYGKYTGTEWFCDKHSGHTDKFWEDASYHEYHSKHWFCADGEARA